MPTVKTFSCGNACDYRAVDGILNTVLEKANEECTHTDDNRIPNQWWLIDLEKQERVTHVALTNRGDCCCMLFNSIFSPVAR